MKKVLVLCAVMALAIPAMADVQPITIDASKMVASPADMGTPGGAEKNIPNVVYSHVASQAGGIGAGAAWATAPGAGNYIIDDIHPALSNTFFTHFEYTYQGAAFNHSDQVKFWINNADNHLATTLAWFNLTGLNSGGAWTYTITLATPLAIPHGASLWMGISPNDGASYWGNSAAAAIGSNHASVMYNGPAPAPSSTGFVNTTGNLCVGLGIPEPTTIGLFVIGGLVALYRRR